MANLKPHPAKYSQELLPYLREYLQGYSRILDPFAGVGTGGLATVYGEMEEEWLIQCPGLRVLSDATRLPYRDGCFDAVVTSPVYGNRMSDHFEARDFSHRITYRHYLGKALRERNAGKVQWGGGYQSLHGAAWFEVRRVLRPGGRFVLNIADHIRAGERIKVSQWHLDKLLHMGFDLVAARRVDCPGMRQGENGKSRVPYQYIYCLEKP